MPSLKLIVLKTKRVQLVREFYSQLGFCFTEEQHGNGPLHYSAPLGDGILEIYPLPDGVPTDATTRLGFTASGVESIFESLDNSDAVVSVPKQTEWGLRGVVRDPDGRTVELYETSRAGGQ